MIALDGGIDGLDVIKKIIYKSKSLLKENGILAIEIGYGQYPNVSCILENQGLRIINKVCDNNKLFNIAIDKLDFGSVQAMHDNKPPCPKPLEAEETLLSFILFPENLIPRPKRENNKRLL